MRRGDMPPDFLGGAEVNAPPSPAHETRARVERRIDCLCSAVANYRRKRLLEMLRVASSPWFPPALITTLSISEPLSTTTKLATTVGRPSVKLMVKVPVQSGFTV